MKKILSLVSVLTIAGAPMLTLNAMSLYDVKNNLEITNFKTNKQEKKLIKIETNINQESPSFIEDFELETPITKVTAFYIHSSDENTFIWTKKLPQGTKYNLFTVEVKEKSNYWAEGLDFNYFNQKVHLPLGSMNNIWLINNKQQDKTIIEERRVTLLGEPMNSRLIDVINIKLSLNLQYFNNVITARFTASAAVKNTSLFSWVKTQAKFYFKISVSKNGSL